jgi:nicotinate-nucleotide adenylyltransferase
LGISATAIRELVAGGHSPRYLLPDAALDIIRRQGLYGHRADRSAADLP